MSTVLVPSLQIKRRTVVRRRRELPISGKVLVELNANVNETEYVAAAQLPGEMRIVRVAEELGIEPHEASELIGVKEGDAVSKGRQLAERSGLFGLFRSRVNSPIDGTIELVSRETGHIAVRAPSVKLELKAYLRGKVVEIDPGRAVTIENQVSLIQGIFGVGGERSGRLRVLNIAPTEHLTERHIEGAKPGDIIAGGCRPSAAALRAAGEAGIVGMVVGSLDDRALSSYLGYELGIALTGDEDVPVTVMMTEGFGSLAIADHALKLLSELDGVSASINGATQVRAGAVRPELIVFSEGVISDHSGEQPVTMGLGVRVRIIRVPYFGQYGEIVELPHALELLESGGRARVLKVRLDTGDIVTIPRANIELI